MTAFTPFALTMLRILSAISARTGLELVTRDAHFKAIKMVAKELRLIINH